MRLRPTKAPGQHRTGRGLTSAFRPSGFEIGRPIPLEIVNPRLTQSGTLQAVSFQLGPRDRASRVPPRAHVKRDRCGGAQMTVGVPASSSVGHGARSRMADETRESAIGDRSSCSTEGSGVPQGPGPGGGDRQAEICGRPEPPHHADQRSTRTTPWAPGAGRRQPRLRNWLLAGYCLLRRRVGGGAQRGGHERRARDDEAEREQTGNDPDGA